MRRRRLPGRGVAEMSESQSPLHGSTVSSETYQLLHDAPRTRDEIPGRGLPSALRNNIVRLKPTQTTARAKSRPDAKTVYYLWGDDRRAVRAFIEHNEVYISSLMTDGDVGHALDWEDVLVSLLYEEWQAYQEVADD